MDKKTDKNLTSWYGMDAKKEPSRRLKNVIGGARVDNVPTVTFQKPGKSCSEDIDG